MISQRRSFRPSIEEIENRIVLSPVALHPIAHHGHVAHHAPAHGHVRHAVFIPAANVQAELSFLQAHVGVRVGGGECAQLASEALRVAGFAFQGGLTSPAGSYVWGNLIGAFRPQSSPSAAVQPGDVLQFQDSVFVTQNSIQSTRQHTAIVAAVNSSGLPTQVYEQNIVNSAGSEERFVHLDPINLSTLQQGVVSVYRPVPRVDAPGETLFSIVNNAATPQQVSVRIGTQVISTLSLDVANTAGSYFTYSVTTTGSAQPNLQIGNVSIPVHSGAGYEVITLSSGAVGLAALNP
jgi:hypothetical protein